jgi:hypothetical protein
MYLTRRAARVVAQPRGPGLGRTAVRVLSCGFSHRGERRLQASQGARRLP